MSRRARPSRSRSSSILFSPRSRSSGQFRADLALTLDRDGLTHREMPLDPVLGAHRSRPSVAWRVGVKVARTVGLIETEDRAAAVRFATDGEEAQPIRGPARGSRRCRRRRAGVAVGANDLWAVGPGPAEDSNVHQATAGIEGRGRTHAGGSWRIGSVDTERTEFGNASKLL